MKIEEYLSNIVYRNGYIIAIGENFYTGKGTETPILTVWDRNLDVRPDEIGEFVLQAIREKLERDNHA